MKFIDLFAGIGGFHFVFKRLDFDCVFACENDKYARKTYISNHSDLKDNFAKDINAINISEIPDFDLLCAGFPCQSFSIIGNNKGFNCDKNGNLFYKIVEILKEKQPKVFFLENVRGLVTHNKSETFKIIEKTIKDLGYSFYWKIMKASDYGLPQFRPRIYIVGFKDTNLKFEFPKPISLNFTMSDVLGGKCDKEIGYTIRVGGRNGTISDCHNWDTYIVEGKEKRLTINNMKKMMGFPENFVFPVSRTQAMKQLGNSVAIDVVMAIGKNIMETLSSCNK